MRALHMRGRILMLRGDVAQALDAAERCVALDAMWDIPLLRSDRTSLLGQARLRAGRHADGLALVEEAARTDGLSAFGAYSFVRSRRGRM